MLRLVTDENFNGDIVRGLLRRHPELDLVRVQDVGLVETPDPTSLSGPPARDVCWYRTMFRQSYQPRTTSR